MGSSKCGCGHSTMSLKSDRLRFLAFAEPADLVHVVDTQSNFTCEQVLEEFRGARS